VEAALNARVIALPLPRERDSGIELGFRALYDREVAFVWRNLRRLGVPLADVDDRCQEVFVVAHRRWADFADYGRGVRPWLYAILVRVVSEARRHRRRHPEDSDGGATLERQRVEAAQAGVVMLRERVDRLDRALARVEVGRRMVLVLHEVEELSAPEIAQALGIPVNTVYSRLRVARAELEEALRADGEDA